MWIARCGRLAWLWCMLGLAGCQSLPTPNTVESVAPAAPVPVASEPFPKAAPVASAAKQERALASHIARLYAVDDGRASHVVRAASGASRRTGLPRTLILAVIAVESSFDPMAVSRAGARGLMQVLPEAHPEKVSTIGGERMLHDVDSGVQVGSRILLEYQRMTGNLRSALVRYSGAARNYVNKVLARKHNFDLIEAAVSSPLRSGLLWVEQALALIDTGDADGGAEIEPAADVQAAVPFTFMGQAD